MYTYYTFHCSLIYYNKQLISKSNCFFFADIMPDHPTKLPQLSLYDSDSYTHMALQLNCKILHVIVICVFSMLITLHVFMLWLVCIVMYMVNIKPLVLEVASRGRYWSSFKMSLAIDALKKCIRFLPFTYVYIDYIMLKQFHHNLSLILFWLRFPCL